MAIFVRNLSFTITSQLGSKLISTPWVKRVNFIKQCKRDYQSSNPIRYIPKKPLSDFEAKNQNSSKKKLETTEFENFPDSVLASKFQQTNPILDFESGNKTGKIPLNQENLYEDVGEFIKLEEESTPESEEVINENGVLSEGEVKWTSKTKDDVEKVAIQLLAKRAFTSAELRKKLHGKGFSPKVIDEVVAGLRSRGYIDDYLYAETFSQSRWSTSTWGPRRIKQALNQKGVSKADAEKATKHVFENENSGGENESSHGMSKQAMDHLFVQVSKQWLRGQDVPHDKRKARIVRWLQYRGFNWGVISFILKKLESQRPS